jgi:Cu/Ag efflux pump CusA
VDVRFDPVRGAAFGLTPGDVRRAAATLVQGTKVGEFYEAQKVFDVVVWGTPDVRRNLDAIRALQVPLPSGGVVPLGSVSTVEITPTPNEITRENGSRRIDVTSNVRGRDLGAVALHNEAQLDGWACPRGYYAEVLGEHRSDRPPRPVSCCSESPPWLPFFSFSWLTSDLRVATLVFLTLPFALVGAIVSAFLTGGVLSLGSLVGLVTVIGISARNGIMLISHYRHLELQEGMTFGRDLILRGLKNVWRPFS